MYFSQAGNTPLIGQSLIYWHAANIQLNRYPDSLNIFILSSLEVKQPA